VATPASIQYKSDLTIAIITTWDLAKDPERPAEANKIVDKKLAKILSIAQGDALGRSLEDYLGYDPHNMEGEYQPQCLSIIMYVIFM